MGAQRYIRSAQFVSLPNANALPFETQASKQEDRARINALSPLSSPRGDGVAPTMVESTMRMNPLLRDFEGVSTSIDTSSKALGELNEHLASFYMATVMKKTSLDRQSIALDSIQLQSKLEKSKEAAHTKRCIIARLRGEHEQLTIQIEKLKRAQPTSGFTVSPASLNTWFSAILLILPLLAIFLAARIILHPEL